MTETIDTSESFSPQDLLDDAPVAIIVHDFEDRVLYWNKVAASLYGWSAEEIMGRPIARIFYLDVDSRKADLAQLEATGEWSGELRQIDREGHEYLVDVRQKFLLSGDGITRAVLSYNRDITEERKKEDAAERAHHIRSSSLLAGGVAHELNNALAPIMLSSAMLKRMVEGEKATNMVDMIEKCANKGAQLITDLLSFERGKGGGDQVIRKTQILRALQRGKEAVVPESIEFQVHLSEDLWEFFGEITELGQSFQHVMQNACEAMPEGGVLSIDATNCACDEHFVNLAPEAKVGDYVRIAFKDEGFGIAPDIVQRVAEPFFTTKEPKQGYGFGLSSTQAIVKGHKGFMVLESTKEVGTTLTLYLPALVKRQEVSAAASGALEKSEGQGRLVLVADDELFVRETIKTTLKERGYRVVTAEDGTGALAAYANQKDEIDVVVTNVDMPFMDGPALCRALKKLNPDVKILVSSGFKQREKVLEIKSCGIEHFLPKPYTADKLADTMKIVLEG